MDNRKIMGFAPVFTNDSLVLILGSFPSVKSREISFYYGHKQNRFWRMVCGYFKEPVPENVEDRRDFLIRRKIALWDMVTSCEIVGSSDATIKNPETADLTQILQTAPIKKILLNGNVAYSLFCKKYQGISLPYEKLPSTSPANPRFNEEVWWRALDDVFRIS